MEKNTSPIKDIPPARELTIYTDGASRGNPGEAGAGAVIYGEVLHLFSDSELMVRQIKGIYKVRDRKMQALLKEIKNSWQSLCNMISFVLRGEEIEWQIN